MRMMLMTRESMKMEICGHESGAHDKRIDENEKLWSWE